ncbi:MAG: hypothetical protein ACREGI_05190 [Candidatus Levyibacteriota bacterium]
MEKQENQEVFHDMQPRSSGISPQVVVVFIVVVVLAVVTGYLFSKKSTSTGPVAVSAPSSASSIAKGAVYGSNDTQTFKDTAEGVLQKGGIDSEGQYHLVRPGGDSQSVYMTSSLVDLSLFVGRKVKVWGQTQAAKSAGWLMDAGRVEVLQ